MNTAVEMTLRAAQPIQILFWLMTVNEAVKMVKRAADIKLPALSMLCSETLHRKSILPTGNDP